MSVKNALKVFFAGVASAFALIAAFLCRKKLHSDTDGVRPDNNKYDDCSESLGRVGQSAGESRSGIAEARRGIADAQRGLAESICILQKATAESDRQ